MNPRLILRKTFTAASLLFAALSKKTYRSPRERRVDEWYADRGDRTLRVEYDLSPDSVVLDLGGYEGDWAAEIFARYQCRVLVFEPVIAYYERIRSRFSRNGRIEAFPFGLASETCKAAVGIAEEGSSLFSSPNVPSGSAQAEISLIKASDFLKEKGIERADLMKINIEGGEYALLEHLLDIGFCRSVRDIQIQFHDFVPGAERRMAEIQRRLAASHSRTYSYEFVWENWRLKGEY